MSHPRDHRHTSLQLCKGFKVGVGGVAKGAAVVKVFNKDAAARPQLRDAKRRIKLKRHGRAPG